MILFDYMNLENTHTIPMLHCLSSLEIGMGVHRMIRCMLQGAGHLCFGPSDKKVNFVV